MAHQRAVVRPQRERESEGIAASSQHTGAGSPRSCGETATPQRSRDQPEVPRLFSGRRRRRDRRRRPWPDHKGRPDGRWQATPPSMTLRFWTARGRSSGPLAAPWAFARTHQDEQLAGHTLARDVETGVPDVVGHPFGQPGRNRIYGRRPGRDMSQLMSDDHSPPQGGQRGIRVGVDDNFIAGGALTWLDHSLGDRRDLI